MANSNDVAPTDQTLSPVLPQHVKHALAYLRANLHEKVTLADLATACAISQRALLKQFKDFLGVSPIAHLARMRLAAARAVFQRSDGTIAISEVISRCGFTNPGRFAADYRKAFGELPSATLRHARQSAAGGATESDTTCVAGGRFAAPPVPFVARERPSLAIVPVPAETLQERGAARELTEPADRLRRPAAARASRRR